MKKNKLKCLEFTAGVFLVLFAGIITVGVFEYAKEDPWNFIINNFISITSFFLTIVSILISVSTYFSIDSVNTMTATTGNHFENKNYSVEYSSKIKMFDDNVKCIKQKKNCSDSEALEEYLIKVLRKKDKSKNFYDFSRHIQNTIDSLIWLDFIDCNNQILQKEMQKFIKRTIKKAAYFESINSGLELLLDENIKLIIATFKTYTKQSSLVKDDNKKNIFEKYYVAKYIKPKDFNCCIQDVRGEMFINPVTKAVYLHVISRELLDKTFIKNNINILTTTYKHPEKVNIENFSSIDKDLIENILKKTSEITDFLTGLSQTNSLLHAMVMETKVKEKYLQYLIDTRAENLKELSDYIISAIEKINKTYQLLILADIEKETYILKCLNEKLNNLKQFLKQMQSSNDFYTIIN